MKRGQRYYANHLATLLAFRSPRVKTKDFDDGLQSCFVFFPSFFPHLPPVLPQARPRWRGLHFYQLAIRLEEIITHFPFHTHPQECSFRSVIKNYRRMFPAGILFSETSFFSLHAAIYSIFHLIRFMFYQPGKIDCYHNLFEKKFVPSTSGDV